jgi:hypothetical protein
MVHTSKIIKHILKRLEKPLVMAFLGLSCLAFVSTGIFFLTKNSTPAASELSFTEHSIIGSNAGSVMPASCESGYLDSYDDPATTADFKCYSPNGDGGWQYDGYISQQTSAQANLTCQDMVGGGPDYVYNFVPGSAKCPVTPTVNLFFSSR